VTGGPVSDPVSGPVSERTAPSVAPGNLPAVRILVVVNPHATGTTARGRDVLAHALGSAGELHVEETANRGHAAALACRAMRSGVEVVVALGGDGTVNEVVNGLLTDGVHDRLPALGVVPGGSTNVFARALDLPEDPFEATGALLSALRTGSRRSVSLGRVGDGDTQRWFTFATGIGFDAAIVGAVETQRRKGRRSSHLLYAEMGIQAFFRSDRRHRTVHVQLPEGTVLDDVFYAVITNVDPWTYVGSRPLRPTPEASLDTGLDLYARRRMSTLGTLISMIRLSGANPHISARSAHLRHDLAALSVRADEPLPVQVDGEYLGMRDTLTLTAVIGAIDVLV
jgi:diacylglycerol kinase family enzyme